MEEMQKLLEKLKFSPSYLDGGKLLQIRCNKEKTNFEFVIEVNTITVKKYNEFIKRLKGYYPLKHLHQLCNLLLSLNQYLLLHY